MKTSALTKLVSITILASLSLSSMEGTIRNSRTGEEIKLKLNQRSKQLDIVSSAVNVPSTSIILKEIKAQKSDINLVAANDAYSDAICEKGWGRDDCLEKTWLVPGANVVRIGTTLFDLVAMIYKGPAKMSENSRYEEDLKKLKTAIASKKTIEVGPERFERISKLVLEAIYQ